MMQEFCVTVKTWLEFPTEEDKNPSESSAEKKNGTVCPQIKN